VADVHVYIHTPTEKEGMALENLEGTLRKLAHVSDVNSPGNVVAVSYEGEREQQEEIERCRGNQLRSLEAIGEDNLRGMSKPLGVIWNCAYEEAESSCSVPQQRPW
jgi:hypothetical protein